jgi:outer membrane protein OmpA-like peptidoglycan-associated protein
MRPSVAIIVFGVAVSAQALAAVDPATPQSSKDYVKAIQALKSQVGAATSGDGDCEPGEVVVNEQGDCGKPVVNRGADLAGSHVSPASGRPPRTHLGSVRRVSASSVSRVSYAAPPPTSVLGSLPITFRLGSADLTPAGRSQVRLLATAMLSPEVTSTRFQIAGHTDASGSPERNRVLSLARAESVKSYLVDQGVEPSRLEAKGYGADGLARPEAPLDPVNRRVEARPIP